MANQIPLFSFLALLVAPMALHAAPASTQEQEYEQMRKVALRDPKVRAAYAEADRKLEAKILQIDPALAPYLRQRTGGSTTTATAKPAPAPRPASAPAAHPFQHAHVVVKGDTLGSIALKYGVTVAALKTANHISDEKKLAVGHVLAIPEGRASR